MKTILLLTTLTVLANASYEQAQEFYDNKEYKNAIKEVKASTSEYSNPKLHLVWAKSEEALGHTKEAMLAFERVAILDETDSESRVELASIYKETQRDSLAEDMSKELQNYQLTPAQRSSLDLLKKENLDSFKAQATLSAGYDTNINVSASSDALDDYTGLLNDGEKSTLFAQFNGSLSYIHDLESKGGWYVRGDLKVYYQNNADAHFYDMLTGGLEAGVGYAGNGYTVYLPVAYDRVNYLDTDLLSQLSIKPYMNYTLSKDFILNINVRYTDRSYNEEKYTGMADSSFGGGLGLYYLFGKNFVYGNILYEEFSSSESIHFSFIDKQMFTLSLGVNYNLASWLVSRLDYRYRNGSYDDSSDLRDPSITTSRSDDYNQVELKFSHYFANHYELYLSNRYVNNSSNYIPAKYTKNITMFGISANY